MNTADVQVSISGGGGGKITGSGSKYTVTVATPTTPGQFCNIDVINRKTGQKISSTPFRVKRIPDPQAQIGGKTDGKITEGEMKVQGGIVALLQNFDFDAKCSIQSYEMVCTPPRADASPPMVVSGPRFDAAVSGWIQKARPGAIYQFYNIKGTCPGDAAGRKLNGITLSIR
jgi:hypothetical protein